LLYRLPVLLALLSLTVLPVAGLPSLGSEVAYAQDDAAAAPPTASAVTVSIDPAASTLTAGDTVDLTFLVSSGDQQVDGVQLQIVYDPTRLQPIASDGTPAGTMTPEGAAVAPLTPVGPLDLALRNEVDVNAGRIDYAVGSLSSTPTGTFQVATGRFRTLAGTDDGGTMVRLSTEGAFPSYVSFGGRLPVNLIETSIIILGDPPAATPAAPPSNGTATSTEETPPAE